MLSSNLYNDQYFQSERCEGFEEYKKHKLSPIRKVELDLLSVSEGDRFLDLGCGRGDICRHYSNGRNNIDVWGVDYSHSSIKLCRQAVKPKHRKQILLSDARKTKLKSNFFDKVLLGDIIEHMTYTEALELVQEAHRVLKPGGKLIIHTSPNTWFTNIVYPIVRIALIVSGQRATLNKLDENIKATYKYHEDEYSPLTLRRLLRKSNFSLFNVWVNRDVLRNSTENYLTNFRQIGWVCTLAKIINSSLLVNIFGNDLFVKAIKE